MRRGLLSSAILAGRSRNVWSMLQWTTLPTQAVDFSHELGFVGGSCTSDVCQWGIHTHTQHYFLKNDRQNGVYCYPRHMHRQATHTHGHDTHTHPPTHSHAHTGPHMHMVVIHTRTHGNYWLSL